jgi:hypothetical protein
MPPPSILPGKQERRADKPSTAFFLAYVTSLTVAWILLSPPLTLERLCCIFWQWFLHESEMFTR